MSESREASVFERIFGPMPASSTSAVRREALLDGYKKGFEAARDRIADILEEEGKSQTANRVRKIRLQKKS